MHLLSNVKRNTGMCVAECVTFDGRLPNHTASNRHNTRPIAAAASGLQKIVIILMDFSLSSANK